jgi:hypothetical protein
LAVVVAEVIWIPAMVVQIAVIVGTIVVCLAEVI